MCFGIAVASFVQSNQNTMNYVTVISRCRGPLEGRQATVGEALFLRHLCLAAEYAPPAVFRGYGSD